MDFIDESIPLNKTVDAAVRKFAEDIVCSAKSFNPDIEVVLEYDGELRIDHKERSHSATIQSIFGVVSVFPDFAEQSAKAATVNRGLIYAMTAEGFSDEEIDAAVIYGKLVASSKEALDGFGLFLTKDFGIQAQKGVEIYEN